MTTTRDAPTTAARRQTPPPTDRRVAAWFIAQGRDPEQGEWRVAPGTPRRLLWNGGRTAILVRGDGCEDLPEAGDGWHYYHPAYVFPPEETPGADDEDFMSMVQSVSEGRFEALPATTPEGLYADYMNPALQRAVQRSGLSEAVQAFRSSLPWLVAGLLLVIFFMVVFIEGSK